MRESGRRVTDGCLTDQYWAVPYKMICPTILPRIDQRDALSLQVYPAGRFIIKRLSRTVIFYVPPAPVQTAINEGFAGDAP
jgi:hypothetical protein